MAPEVKLLQTPPPLLDFSQSHDVGVLVDASVKSTLTGAVPDVGVPLKSATGGVGGGDPLSDPLSGSTDKGVVLRDTRNLY